MDGKERKQSDEVEKDGSQRKRGQEKNGGKGKTLRHMERHKRTDE